MSRIKVTRTEKRMLALAGVIALAGLGGGYYFFAAGVAVATPVSLFLLRWQMAAVANLDNLDPRRAFNRFLGRSLLRSGIALGLVALALPAGVPFIFGVLAGLLLQVLAGMGEAILNILGKEG